LRKDVTDNVGSDIVTQESVFQRLSRVFSQVHVDSTLNKVLFLGCAGLIVVAIYLIDNPQLNRQVATSPTQNEQGTAAPQQASQPTKPDHVRALKELLEPVQEDRAWNNKGDAYYNTKQYAKAIKAYQQAIRINPDYADAWYKLGNAYAEIGQPGKANEAYRQAFQVNHDKGKATLLLPANAPDRPAR
jgi:tetratricopeptide (TPR) repeat protein